MRTELLLTTYVVYQNNAVKYSVNRAQGSLAVVIHAAISSAYVYLSTHATHWHYSLTQCCLCVCDWLWLDEAWQRQSQRHISVELTNSEDSVRSSWPTNTACPSAVASSHDGLPLLEKSARRLFSETTMRRNRFGTAERHRNSRDQLEQTRSGREPLLLYCRIRY